jgi:hypothetical protein
VCAVTGLDTKALQSDGRVWLNTDVKLLDSGTLANLWSGTYGLEVKVEEASSVVTERDTLLARAIDRYAASLMRELPARVPRSTPDR